MVAGRHGGTRLVADAAGPLAHDVHRHQRPAVREVAPVHVHVRVEVHVLVDGAHGHPLARSHPQTDRQHRQHQAAEDVGTA